MKNLLFVLMLFIAFNNYSQTKEETIEWLNIKLEEFGDNVIMGTYQISTKKDINYGESLIFIEKSWNPLLKKNTYKYYSFLPKVISKIYLSTKNRTNSTLDIFIHSNKKSIYRPKDEKFVSEFSIYMKNGHNDEAKRIQRGLLHLLELMGNKIEPQKEFFTN